VNRSSSCTGALLKWGIPEMVALLDLPGETLDLGLRVLQGMGDGILMGLVRPSSHAFDHSASSTSGRRRRSGRARALFFPGGAGDCPREQHCHLLDIFCSLGHYGIENSSCGSPRVNPESQL
jgi:hypothetical protein